MLELGLKVFISYLIGSLNGSLIIGRMSGVDIRAVGSGNAGGTNALRTQGKMFAFWVLLIDVGKGKPADLAAASLVPAVVWARPGNFARLANLRNWRSSDRRALLPSLVSFRRRQGCRDSHRRSAGYCSVTIAAGWNHLDSGAEHKRLRWSGHDKCRGCDTGVHCLHGFSKWAGSAGVHRHVGGVYRLYAPVQYPTHFEWGRRS